MSSETCLNDDTFGPAVKGCRGDFDFTVKFERIFFSIVPAAVFIALALARIAVLARRSKKVSGCTIKFAKLAVIGGYAALQFAILILRATGSGGIVRGLSVAGSALLFVAAVVSLPLSFLEHERSRKPSALLGSYLLLTIILDVVKNRTAWMSLATSGSKAVAGIFSASIGVVLLAMILEAVPKGRWLEWDDKEHSPEETMSMFAQSFWTWPNRLLLRGNRGIIDVDKLYPLDSRMGAKVLHDKFSTKMDIDKCRTDKRFGLLRDLFRTMPEVFVLPVVPRIAYIGFKYCQPFFINTTLSYLAASKDERRENLGYGLIGAAFFIYTSMAVSNGLYQYYNTRAVFQARAALSAAIYRQTTRSKITAADDSAALTLMSTDIERFIIGGQYTHEVWATAIEVAIGLWLLNDRLGLAFLATVLTVIFAAAVTFGILRVVGRRQKAWMDEIQKRVGLTSNAIASMKLYKLSGMVNPVAKQIQALREVEIRVGRRLRWTIIVCIIMGFTPFNLAPVFTFAVTSSTLDTSNIYTSFSFIILVTQPLGLVFQTLPTVLSALACLQRMQKFLAAEPREDYREFIESGPSTPSADSSKTESESALVDRSQCAFKVEKGSFGWSPSGNMTLRNIDTQIPAQSLTFVVGPVASGKSTFCKVLLGEVPEHTGSVTAYMARQSIGYCEQTPFLYNATLRDNIVGEIPFDQARFDEVIHATLLAIDISLLSDGVDTKLGSGGIMLSGGQKQRVSVARALYSRADVLIFDDVLSGLDLDTEGELFRRVFGPGGLLRKRQSTTIICTHSVRHLPVADHIIAFGAEGTVVEQGSFAHLQENESYIQSLNIQEHSNEKPEVDESKSNKKATPAKKAKAKKVETKSEAEDKARQNGDYTVYVHWFKNVHPLSTVALGFLSAVYAFCNSFAPIWLKYWSEDLFNMSNGFYVGVFALLRVLDMAALTSTCIVVMIVMITFAGSRLHKDALTTVINAPLSYLTATDTGTITNLFSQDLTLIDGELLMGLTNVSLQLPQVIGMLIVVASASPYLAISYPFLIGALYFIQRFYLRTSRQMRLLDLEYKTPLYTKFIDTITGVATIRAFGWESNLISQNDQILDTSQRPAYQLMMIQRWLAVVMQLVVAGLAVGIIALATQLDTNSGLTGASLVTLLTFGDTLTHLIMSYTILETCLGAVNRLRTFSLTVKPEDRPEEDQKPPVEWPREGRITLMDVSASYGTPSPDADKVEKEEKEGKEDGRVLKDINLSIKPGEKVALSGRTGSGKSSLILMLTRLLCPLPNSKSTIEIDGLDLATVDRKTLRERLITIPQDAVFLPDGTSIRQNVDTLGGGSEEDCIAALQAVGLNGFLQDKGGLGASMSPDDLSAGQKQLFSLAKAILRKRVRDHSIGSSSSGVLLLDEVSSNVDLETDAKMQAVIKHEFANYTIVMVSHRLEMVVEFFDKVVVLDQGRVVEVGNPKELSRKKGGWFWELWRIAHRGKAPTDEEVDEVGEGGESALELVKQVEDQVELEMEGGEENRMGSDEKQT